MRGENTDRKQEQKRRNKYRKTNERYRRIEREKRVHRSVVIQKKGERDITNNMKQKLRGKERKQEQRREI